MTAKFNRQLVAGNNVSSVKRSAKGSVDETCSAPMRDIPTIARRLVVSEKTVRRLIRRGELRAYRIGRQFRVSEQDLLNFLESSLKEMIT
jgi:excisionase family DNA binding protein